MTKSQESLYTKIAIGAGIYFFVVRPLLQKVGIVKTAEDKLVESQTNLGNSQNAFSPIFYKTGPAGTKLLTYAGSADLAKRIYEAMGYFTDDESAVYSVFRSLKTKSQVSFLAERFASIYGVDLLEYLKRGRNQFNPGSGMNTDELAVVLNIVNKLPSFK